MPKQNADGVMAVKGLAEEPAHYKQRRQKRRAMAVLLNSRHGHWSRVARCNRRETAYQVGWRMRNSPFWQEVGDDLDILYRKVSARQWDVYARYCEVWPETASAILPEIKRAERTKIVPMDDSTAEEWARWEEVERAREAELDD